MTAREWARGLWLSAFFGAGLFALLFLRGGLR